MSEVSPRFPAEWEPHAAVVTAWPWDESLWQENLAEAQAEFVGLLEGVAARPGPSVGKAASAEKLVVLVANPRAREEATARLKHLEPVFLECGYGDIWLRDTAPLFFKSPGTLIAKVLQFNGWGEKYRLSGDQNLAVRLADQLKCRDTIAAIGLKELDLAIEQVPWLGEGGALEFDGEGTVLTSRQCLLNPNRKGPTSEAEVERLLYKLFHVRKVVWVTEGMINDHTDGHIDTIARFVRPGEVAVHAPVDGDPNRDRFLKITEELSRQTDAHGRPLQLHLISSAGEVRSEEGEIMPASHLNFYIGNNSVVVPTYGTPSASLAVAQIAELFPDRLTVGRPSKAILSGGGSFHCITQQIPR